MRTTVEFDDDTAKAVEQLRNELGIGVSQAVNELIRRALMPRPEGPPFRQRTQRLGIRIDVSNVAAALEDLEGIEAR
jgi:Ribbon-helix-helix protein, copG family